jgi:hypothetical protein
MRLIGVIRMRMASPAPAKQRDTNSHTRATKTTTTLLYLMVVMLHHKFLRGVKVVSHILDQNSKLGLFRGVVLCFIVSP